MEMKHSTENIQALIDQVTPDLEGFLEARLNPDCVETAYSLSGEEIREDAE